MCIAEMLAKRHFSWQQQAGLLKQECTTKSKNKTTKKN